jgi:cytidyltransferase-like protein
MVFGTFDYLHPGHQFVLLEAKKRSKNIVVVIARDATVERIKGRRPRIPEKQRQKSVQNFLPQATVVLGDIDDVLVPVRLYMPKSLLLGYDQQLPPGITFKDLPCPIERLPAFHPHLYKSSLIKSDNEGH